MKLLQRSILGTVLVLIITLCLGYVVNKQAVGLGVFDLTSNSRYTLTEGTRGVLDKLQRPLTIRLYYAKTAVSRTGYNQLAQFNNHYYYVRDLLRAMARYGDGKLKVVEYDPRPFSDAAEEADTFGIRAFPLGQQTNEVFYFGLALTSDTGAREVIEFLHPNNQGRVEYDVVELMDRATHRKKSKIGVMSPLKVVGENLTPQMMQMRQMLRQPVQRSWAVIQELRQRKYDIVEVATDADQVPEDVNYLLVIHPKDLQDKTLFAIDQFVMRGGKAMFFVDPYCEVDAPPRDPRNQFAGMSYNRSSNINKLLEAWGVRMEVDKFAGDRALAGRVRLPNARSTTSYIGYVMLGAGKKCFNDSEIVSQGLNEVVMLYPGSLKRVEGRDTQVTSLIRTTSTGNTWHASTWEIGGPMGFEPARINPKLEDGEKPLMLAAKITGKFKSAFPGGLPGAGKVTEDPDNPDAVKPTSKPDSDTDVDPDAKPDTKPDVDPDAKPDAKPDVDADAKPDTKGDVDPDAKPDVDPDVAPDAVGPPPDSQPTKQDDDKPGHLTESKQNTAVVVVADVDLIADAVAYQQTFFGSMQTNSNAPLLLNVLEHLSASEDLINVRARGKFSRKFDRIIEIRDRAEKKTELQVKRIEKEIENYQAELSQLQSQADEKNVGALNSEALAKKKRTEKKIKAKRWELRKLKSEEREEIESVKQTARRINLWLIPAFIAAIGFVLWIIRLERRRTQVLGGVS
ncbi:MAG: Gldg family protein [Planctomycetota bacterium]|jgi:ABC-type uncharacterized transport system involved in gliding motility auxiliary subunit